MLSQYGVFYRSQSELRHLVPRKAIMKTSSQGASPVVRRSSREKSVYLDFVVLLFMTFRYLESGWVLRLSRV